VPAIGCVNGPTTGGASVRLVGATMVKVLVVVDVPPLLVTVAVTVLVPDGKAVKFTE
jgi:hypothetical protein